uniref:SHSP domain-containing protein n=1 Tax=Sinocyclocheilus anshuiensis TaxID=1608454 RepID=A0A671L0D7_9TELE
FLLRRVLLQEIQRSFRRCATAPPCMAGKEVNLLKEPQHVQLVFLSAPGGSGVGVVRATGDSYFLSADVSGFEPHEVVLLVYNQCVAIHAEKMAADGSVAGRFTHKSVLPADMDPLSVSSSLTAERRLIISVGRSKSPHEKLITFFI